MTNNTQVSFKDYYKFFFTHLAQENRLNNPLPWVEVEPLSANYLYLDEPELSNINITISNLQPEGVLDYTVLSGKYLLDTSNTIDISTTEITVDNTLQNISNYKSTVTTPIKPPSITQSLVYDLARNSDNLLGVKVSNTYPKEKITKTVTGTYPHQNVYYVKTLNIPWLVESAELNRLEIPTGQVAFADLTVDNTTLTVDQSHLTNLDSDLLSADRTTYTVSATTQTALISDIAPVNGSPSKVTINRVPVGLGILDWRIDNRSISKTWIPFRNRGYIPSDTISKDMKGANLKHVALGLMGLLATKNVTLIISLLNELGYIWSELKSLNSSSLGLPSFIPKLAEPFDLNTLSKERYILDQAWIGLALVKAIRFLRDRPDGQLIELPKNTKPLLDDLTKLVNLAIDSSTGVIYKAFDSEGYVLDEEDPSAAFIAQLFLEATLPINYAQESHKNSSVLNRSIEANPIVSDNRYVGNLDSEFELELDSTYYSQFDLESKTKAYIAINKLFWNVTKSRYSGSEKLIEIIKKHLITKDLSSFYYGLLDYVIPFVESSLEQTFDIPLLSTKVTPSLPGTFSYKNNEYGKSTTLADLCASTWIRIKLHAYSIFPLLDFNTYSEAAYLFLSESYLEAKRMMPFGYKWASSTAQEAGRGRLGALLYASVFPSLNWFLLEKILKEGISLLGAQCWALDLWGQSLNRQRPELQSDIFFKRKLFFSKNKNQCTKEGLRQLVNSIYIENVDFVEPEIISVKYGQEFEPWSENPTLINKINSDTLVELNKFRYPYQSIIDEGISTIKKWEDSVPSISVYSPTYLPEFEEEIHENVSAGVQKHIFVSNVNTKIVNSFVY